MMKKLLLPLLLASEIAAFDFSTYVGSKELTPGYTIHWKTSGSDLHLALSSDSDAWVGVGLSEPTSGSMPGSDMLVCTTDPDGNPIIEDRYAVAFSTPALDDCQDWILDTYESSPNHVWAVHRSLVSEDTQDRNITEGLSRIVWARGAQFMFSQHIEQGGDLLPFNGVAPETPSFPFSADYIFSAAQIPPQQTTYMCQAFDLPPVAADHHATYLEVLVDPATVAVVHHLLVHVCTPGNNTHYDMYKAGPGECSSPVGDSLSGCSHLMYAWAVGSAPLVLPSQAGFRIGPNGASHIVVEIHYNNPALTSGLVDSSGVRIGYTNVLRQHDASVMTLGDPYAVFSMVRGGIPAGAVQEYVAECPSACTSEWDHPLHVFADFLHMHATGQQIWSNRYSNTSTFLGETNRVDFWHYDAQQFTPVDFDIHPGDRIFTHCVFNGRGRAGTTNFGAESSDEMCMEFIAYYPALTTSTGSAYAYCGFVPSFGVEPYYGASVCGDPSFSSIRYDIPNPSAEDTRGGATLFGTTPSECASQTSSSAAETSSSASSFSLF